jgi:hypothetical protein
MYHSGWGFVDRRLNQLKLLFPAYMENQLAAQPGPGRQTVYRRRKFQPEHFYKPGAAARPPKHSARQNNRHSLHGSGLKHSGELENGCGMAGMAGTVTGFGYLCESVEVSPRPFVSIQ